MKLKDTGTTHGKAVSKMVRGKHGGAHKTAVGKSRNNMVAANASVVRKHQARGR